MGILAWLNPIQAVTEAIAKAYTAKQNATTDRERIEAEERIKTLEARRDVMVAEAGSRINSFMRAALAAPVAILLWKVLVYDKAFGQWTGGRTDDLSPDLWWIVGAVIGFYFLYEGVARLKR